MEHGGRHWISAKGKPPHSVEVQVCDELLHDASYEGGGRPIKSHATHVHVVVRLPARCQGHAAPYDGQFPDGLDQVFTISHLGSVSLSHLTLSHQEKRSLLPEGSGESWASASVNGSAPPIQLRSSRPSAQR